MRKSRNAVCQTRSACSTSHGLVDAQIGYEFQSGSKFAGLSILLQGQNLSNEPFVTYQAGDTTQVIDNQNFGRRFLFGIGYKFGMNK